MEEEENVVSSYFEDINTLPTQQEDEDSSFKDYMITNSAIGMDIYHPEAITKQTDLIHNKVIDFADEEFKKYYEEQPIDVRQKMIQAQSNEEAYKIGLRNEIQAASMERISKDGITTQLGMGLVTGLANPSTILPVGLIGGTLFKTSLAASKLTRVGAAGAAGAIGGGVANVIDESVFDYRDMHYSYTNAMLYGAAFGGVLGTGAGVLDTMFRGPNGNNIANIVATPAVHTAPPHSGIAEGTIAEPTRRNIFDKTLPFITDSVAKGFQSGSATIRHTMSKLATSFEPLKDDNGFFVPQKRNGQDFKRNFNRFFAGLDIEVGKIHAEGINEFKGNRKTLEKEISDVYLQKSNEQEMAAYEAGIKAHEAEVRTNPAATDKELSNIRAKARNDYYNKHDIDYTGINPVVAKGVERYRKYYQETATSGKELKMGAFLDTNLKKMYKTRMFDFQKVDGNIDGAFITAVKNSFEAHPSNKDLTPNEMKELVQSYVSYVMDTNFRQNFNHSAYTIPESDAPASGRLLNRKFRMDETKLKDFLVTDLKELTNMYNHGMSGRQAQHFALGMDANKYIKEMKEKLVEEGNAHLVDDIRALEEIIQDLGNTLRMNPLSNTYGWQATRIAMGANSVRLMGRSGINQGIEIMGNLIMNHLPSMMKGGIGQAIKNSKKMLLNKDGTPDLELNNAILNAGFFQEMLSNHHINRAADTESGFNPGKLEASINWVSHKFFAFNGMRPLKTFQESLVGGAFMHEIPMLANKAELSRADLARISGWGLTPDQVRAVAGEINTHYDQAAGRFDLFSFAPENRDLFQLAITRVIESTVLQGDSMYVPRIYKDGGKLSKMMLQFTRFPMMAQNVFGRRLGEDKGRIAGSMFANLIGYMSFKFLQEEAAYNLGLVEGYKRKHDYFGNEGVEHMRMDALGGLNYVAALGGMSTTYNYGAHIFGMNPIGRDYVSKDHLSAIMGPSYDMIDKTLELTQELGGVNAMTDEKTALLAKTVFVGNLVPIVDEFVKTIIKENF